MASDLSLQRSNFGNLGSVLASLQQGATNDETMNIQANTQYLDIQAQLKGVAQSGFGDLAFGAYELLGQSKALYGRFNTAKESIAKLPDALKATLQKGADKQVQNYEDLKSVGQRAVAGGEDLVNETRSGAEALAQSARDAAAGIESTVRETAAGIESTVRETATSVESNVRDTIQSVQTDVQRTAGEIQTNIGQTAAELRATAEQTATGIRSTVEETAAQVRTNISGLTFDARGIPNISPEDDIFSETFRPPTINIPMPSIQAPSIAPPIPEWQQSTSFMNPNPAPVRSRVVPTVADDEAILPAPRPSAAPSATLEQPAALPQEPIETRDINPNRQRTLGDTVEPAEPIIPEEPIGTALTRQQASRGTSAGLADTLRPDANPQQSMLDFDPEGFVDPRLSDVFQSKISGITSTPYKQLTDLQDVGSKSVPFDIEMKDMISGFTGKQKITLPERPSVPIEAPTIDVPAVGGNVRATVAGLEERMAAYKPGGSLPVIGSNTTDQVSQLASNTAKKVQGGAEEVAQQVQGATQQAAQEVQGAIERTSSQVQGAAQRTGEQLQSAVEQTGAQVQGATQRVGEQVQTTLEEVQSRTGGVLTQGEELVSQTASKATSLVSETTQALQDVGTKVLADATETAVEVAASVLPVVGEVAEVAMGAFQIYEGFKDLFHGPTAAPPPPTIVPQVANIAASFQSGI